MFHPVEHVQYSSNELIKHLLSRPSIRIHTVGNRSLEDRTLLKSLKSSYMNALINVEEIQQKIKENKKIYSNDIAALTELVSHKFQTINIQVQKKIDPLGNKLDQLDDIALDQLKKGMEISKAVGLGMKNLENQVINHIKSKISSASSYVKSKRAAWNEAGSVILSEKLHSVSEFLFQKTKEIKPVLTETETLQKFQESKKKSEDILSLLKNKNAQVHIAGAAPLTERKFGRLFAGMSIPVLMAVAALTPISTIDLEQKLNNANPTQSVQAPSLSSMLKQGQFEISPLQQTNIFDQISKGETVTPNSLVEITDDMSNHQIITKLYEKGHGFEALAMTLEGLETKPYRDGCGLNIGMGYCIDARVREHGVDHVKNDLIGAGLPETSVAMLMGNDRKLQNSVELNRSQAVALLGITKNDYQTRARDIVGQRTFDGLSKNKQAVLTWLSYNTGEGLGNFNNMLSAVRKNDTTEAVKHMTPYFSDGGKMVPNMRAGSWLMASYWSEDAMKTAIHNPDALEYNSRNGMSPIRVVAPLEARRLSANNTLPESPYSIQVTPTVAPTIQAPEINSIRNIASNTFEMDLGKASVSTVLNIDISQNNNEVKTAELSDSPGSNFLELSRRKQNLEEQATQVENNTQPKKFKPGI